MRRILVHLSLQDINHVAASCTAGLVAARGVLFDIEMRWFDEMADMRDLGGQNSLAPPNQGRRQISKLQLASAVVQVVEMGPEG